MRNKWRVVHIFNGQELSTSVYPTLFKAKQVAEMCCSVPGERADICKRPSLNAHTKYWRDNDGLHFIKY